MKTIIPGCSCKEKSYSCESSKYLYLNCEIIKENNKLEDILANWVKPKKIKYKCKNCVIECEAEISKNFYEYPEILIIILIFLLICKNYSYFNRISYRIIDSNIFI